MKTYKAFYFIANSYVLVSFDLHAHTDGEYAELKIYEAAEILGNQLGLSYAYLEKEERK